ncbi:MAG: DUF3795 domain-containing protein [Phycisphaerae bacterium]|jgi:hypothetical protein
MKAISSIAYCGLVCGKCAGYTQSIANLADDLQKELVRNKCDKAAKPLSKIPVFAALKHYDKFNAVLDCFRQMRCKKMCRAGGGSPDCKIKKCVKEKGLLGCWQCGSFEKCKTLSLLEKYGDTDKSYLKNLRKIKKYGPAAVAKA